MQFLKCDTHNFIQVVNPDESLVEGDPNKRFCEESLGSVNFLSNSNLVAFDRMQILLFWVEFFALCD